jgi:periplasmic protein TonB
MIFNVVENEANFPGGLEEWKKYLISKLDAKVAIQEGWKPGIYKIVVEFIVDKEGNIKDVKTLNYEGTKTAAHCIGLIKNGPKWEPAIQNGHKVTSYRKQPISFVIEG